MNTCRYNDEVVVIRFMAIALVLCSIIFALPAVALGGNKDDLEKVTLHLKYRHAFQFAGYYAANAQGYYQAEGLDVRINEANAGDLAIDAVLSGAAEYGVSGDGLLRQRLNGKPIVVLAVIFQHSSYILLSRKDSNIRVPSDLIGRKVMLDESMGGAQFRAMLLNEGVNPHDVKIIPHSWNLDELISGEIDASMVYVTDQPDRMRMRGVEPFVMRLSDYGIDFYGDGLFASENEIKRHPERVAGFLRASLRGWNYAMSHENELIELILDLPGVTERGLTVEHLRYEADQMRTLILSDLVEIGRINPSRWKHMADTYVKLGLLDADYSLEGFIYDSSLGRDYYWLYALLGSFAGVALVVVVLACIWNRQLRMAVHARTRELHESQNAWQTTFDAMSDWVTLIDPKAHTIIATNKRGKAVTGFSLGEIIDNKCYELFNCIGKPHNNCPLQRVLESGKREDMEMKLEGDGGWVLVSVDPVFNEQKEIVSVVHIVKDITKRKLAEASAIELQERLTNAERRESLGILAGGVAHDLNNILGPIVLMPEIIDEIMVDIVNASDEDIADAREYLSFIDESGKRAVAVVKDLQALGRSEYMELKPLDVNQVLNDCIGTHDIDAIRKDHPDVMINYSGAQEGLIIEGDKTALHRILLNLVLNAAESIIDSGQVQVDVDTVCLTKQKLGYEAIESGDYVVINVRDTGEGVPEDFLKKIFDPFVTSKKKFGSKSGSGLGLSVVHSIVKAHNGYIDVERNSEKWVTIFSLYFPSVMKDVQKKESSSEDWSLAHGTENVLVVDDEPGQRFIVRHVLDRLGYTVTEATNGHDALDVLSKLKESSLSDDAEIKAIDLVILDMTMEDNFDGLDTYKAILKLYPELKVVIASGHAEGGRIKAAEKLGASWLAKPYGMRGLAEAVRKVLENKDV